MSSQGERERERGFCGVWSWKVGGFGFLLGHSQWIMSGFKGNEVFGGKGI